MKRFLLHITFFLLPLLAGIIVLFASPLPEKEAYNYITNDCYDRSRWFYQRIFENEKPADIIFMGSSHTICSVRDSVIENELSKISGAEINVLNCGYCRLGISMQYTLLKDILANKNPHVVFFEIREEEDFRSHEMFPYIADSKDVFNAPLIYNADYFNDILKAGQVRLELLKNNIKQGQLIEDTLFSVYGFWPRGETADGSVLQKKQLQQDAFSQKNRNAIQNFFHWNYPDAYIKKMVSMCNEKNIQYAFLYLPAYGDKNRAPLNSAFYNSLGTIITPPAEILDNKLNWSDEGHLNESGANAITLWLIDILKNYHLE